MAPPNEVGGVNELICTRHWEEAQELCAFVIFVCKTRAGMNLRAIRTVDTSRIEK